MRNAGIRTSTARLGAALLILVAFSPIGLGPAAPTALAATPAPNPPVEEACGINVTLVLDASGSIESAHAVENVRDSAEAFLDALANTNSRARVIDFGTVARETAGMDLVTTASLEEGGVHADALHDYYNPKPPIVPPVRAFRYDGSGNPLNPGNYSERNDPQYTNWDAGLRMARGDATNLVVFLTDGDPTGFDADKPGDPFRVPGQDPPNALFGFSGGNGQVIALDRAVEEANTAKGQGARVMAIGVGEAFGPDSIDNVNRLIQVSGPQVVTDADDITDLNAVDVALVEDFDDLQDVLRTVVTQLCSPSLTIRKLAQTAEDASHQPIEDWGITVDPDVVTIANPPFEWVQPAGAPVGPATLQTDANGFANFQWNPIPPAATTVAHVSEEDRTDTTPVEWECQSKDEDGDVTTTSGTLDAVTPAFDVTVGPQHIVTCTIWNDFDYAPGVNVEKTNEPTRVRGDGDGSVVTSTYIVTNTGNTPLTPATGIDDRCAPLTLVSGDTDDDFMLDVTETWTVTCDRVMKSETIDNPPVPIVNTIVVEGTAPDGSSADDSDTADVLVLTPNIFIEKAASPTQVTGSGDVTYTFEVTTTGNMPIDDVTVTDDQCAPVAFDSGDDGDELLEAGETWTYTCEANVTESTVDTATVVGQPIDLGDPLGDTVTDSDTAEVTVIDPRMRLIKTADPNIALQGETVVYTFELRNTSGDGTALIPVAPATPATVVTDDTCGPIVFTAASDIGADGVLSDGESWFYTCTTSYDDAGLVINTATAEMAVQADPTTVLTRQDIAFVLVPPSSVHLTKTPSRTMIHAGDDVTYTYEASNTGLLPLADVAITDDRCDPVDFVSGDTDGDDLLDRTEVWVFECTTTLDQSDDDPTQQETVTNIATITGTPRLGTREGDPITDEATADVILIEPALTVEKVADPTEVRLGETTTYTITVTNTGDSALFYGLIRDDTCEPLELVDDGDGDELAAPGEVWVWTCTAAPAAPTTNTVEVFGIDRLALIVPGTDIAEVDVFDPSIDLVKTVSDDLVASGSTVTYTFVATNTGDDPLTGVVLSDDHCADPTLVSSGNGDAIMDPGEVWTWTCDGVISEETVNTADVSGNDRTDRPVDDIDFATVGAFEAGIAITKTATPTTVVGSGEVTYDYAVTNTGNVPLANVADSVVDDTCPDVTYVSGDDDANELLTGQSDLFETGPPETWLFTCTMTISEDTTNTVVVSGTPVGPGVDGIEVIGEAVDAGAEASVDALDPATITIVKTLVGGQTGSASFTGDLGGFELTIAQGGANRTFGGLAPGTYVVTETVARGQALTGIVCEDPSGGTTTAPPSATINLAEGETVMCTFTNTIVVPPPTDLTAWLPPEVADAVGSSPPWLLVIAGILGALAYLVRRRRDAAP